MIKTKYMFSEAKAKDLAPKTKDQLSSRRLEAKAMASRTPSLLSILVSFVLLSSFPRV